MPRISLGIIDRRSEDQYEFLQWLSSCGFINLARDCERCGAHLRITKSSRRQLDGYALKCWRCQTKASVRSDTIFAFYHTPLPALLKLAVLFQQGESVERAAKLLELGRHIASAFYRDIRELMQVDLDLDPIVFSSIDVVEIDESLIEALREEESPRGRTTGWVFGIVSRDTGQVHLEVVANREATTLLKVMEEHVEAGAIVCGDDWRGYSSIADDYTLLTIKKGRGQMSRWDSANCIKVHTGTIEAIWSELRAILHVSRGFPAHYVPLLLAEFVYRKAGRDVLSLLQL